MSKSTKNTTESCVYLVIKFTRLLISSADISFSTVNEKLLPPKLK